MLTLQCIVIFLNFSWSRVELAWHYKKIMIYQLVITYEYKFVDKLNITYDIIFLI